MTLELAGVFFSIPAGLLFLAFLHKLQALIRAPHDTLLRAVVALLLVAVAVFATSAPPSLKFINAFFGVPNVAAPIAYCALTAFSGSCLVLLIHWRGGPDPRRLRRATRICLIAYALVCVGLVVCFSVADAPVERLRDLDTYYASTPGMREMILLYLFAHTVAGLTMTRLCMRWAREVPGSLRAGLLTMVCGYLLNLCYDVLKYTAITAHWLGRDLDWLSTDLAFAAAGFSAVLIGCGFLIPPIDQTMGSRWRLWHRYRQLRPLWSVLSPAAPHHGVTSLARAPLEVRLVQRENAIHDALLRLAPHLPDSLGRATYDSAVRAGRERSEARLTADATVLTSVMRAHAWRLPEPCDDGPRWSVRSAQSDEDLVALSRAVARLPASPPPPVPPVPAPACGAGPERRPER
ncbi:MAB_1171c family putative transporter (plasmid) [Streptomyces sp. BI20]|uniref:MAB_1171c family putative transporter n=1 Tax=Streptomyces sp. BI20 TaxID=3403460 RepID=UPI003C77748C